MNKRRENTQNVYNMIRRLKREGPVSHSERRLGDPDTIHLVQVLVRDGIETEHLPLYVGYNIDGRAVRVDQATREPSGMTIKPHLLYLVIAPKEFDGIRQMAEMNGILREVSPALS